MRDLVISTSSGGLIAQAGERGDLGFFGGLVQSDGGFLYLEFLFGHAEIDLVFLALDFADDFGFGGFQAGLFHVELGVGQVALVLFAG